MKNLTEVESLAELISPFLESIKNGAIEIYNEFSLQHELGIYLRRMMPQIKIQFERNVGYFFSDKSLFTKREIDITCFAHSGEKPFLAIELKFPRNGQHPEQMFSFCKDIAFAEELVIAGFERAAFIALADDHLFYEGDTRGIYGYFRGGKPLTGQISKPTGKKDSEVKINGTYSISWKPLMGSLKYVIVEVGAWA